MVATQCVDGLTCELQMDKCEYFSLQSRNQIVVDKITSGTNSARPAKKFGSFLPAWFATGRSAAATATTARTPTTTAAAEAVATATPARARFPWTGFVNRQGAPSQLGAVERRHRFIRIGIHRHFDKRESASLPCIPVLHDLYSIHLSVCGECRIQILLGRLERDVPDINVLQGVLLNLLPLRQVDFKRGLISAGKLIEAGKVAVGGFEQPRFNSTALRGKSGWPYCSVADLCANSPITGNT